MLPLFRPLFSRPAKLGLISASRDGDLSRSLIERSGYGTVRGSSSRKGVSALRRLSRRSRAAATSVITPDGPRGPVYEVGPGVIFLAQKSGAAIVPINVEYSSCWRLKSWDRFFVPTPFSSVRFIFGVASSGSRTAYRPPRNLSVNGCGCRDAMMQLSGTMK